MTGVQTCALPISGGLLHVLTEDTIEKLMPIYTRADKFSMTEQRFLDNLRSWFRDLPAFRKREILWQNYLAKVIKQALTLSSIFVDQHPEAPAEWPFTYEDETTYGKIFSSVSVLNLWRNLLRGMEIEFNEGESQIGGYHNMDWMYQEQAFATDRKSVV